jgi:hypothetical protein
MKNPQRVFAFHPFGIRLTAAQAVSRPITRDIAWAAGFYEGEGTCNYATRSQHVVVNQVEREPLEKLQRMFGGTIRPIKAHHRSQASWRWCAHGPRARGVMMTLYVLLSKKRQAQIRKVLHAVCG